MSAENTEQCAHEDTTTVELVVCEGEKCQACGDIEVAA